MKNVLLCINCMLFLVASWEGAASELKSLDGVLQQIEQLENKRDPKCYATASRLEDFMFGTPLSQEARFEKNLLQEQWIRSLWLEASSLAQQQNVTEVSLAQIKPAIQTIFRYRQNEDGHWDIKFPEGYQLRINKDDKRQYSTVAYSLRTLLAVQQQNLMTLPSAEEPELKPLSQAAISQVTEALDLFILSVLKISDQQARNNDSYEIDNKNLTQVWHSLLGDKGNSTRQSFAVNDLVPKTSADLSLLKSIVEQKVRSFAAYNQISNQLFIRNLQVFFARNRWPEDSVEATQFRQQFTETLIAFSADLYMGAQKVALKKGHALISEADVAEFAQTVTPHRINEYEDAIFFPHLPVDEQVVIEAYDMDAFRDSGIHWRYLQFAISDPGFKAILELDPFATELLVENIAQFGVLILRATGDVGRGQGNKRIKLEHFAAGMKLIQSRANKDAELATHVESVDTVLRSAPVKENTGVLGEWFTDQTESVGIDFMHRSSSWLNRLLRSYLKTGENTGTSAIPPAFGGSGVAAGDINNDGFTDLLLLSGLGNRLYINRDGKRFEDITKSAGLVWMRQQDNLSGEPRQPIIADLDNDGLQDIVITYVNDKHRVYRNLGNEKFEDVTDVSQLGGLDLVGGPATVFDYDNDGLLDIYITYFGDYLHGVLPSLKRRNDNGLPNKLFHNLGGFKFVDVTAGSQLDHTGWGQAVTHLDLDGDGLQDLIVGNDFGVNAYFKNLGNGKFENIASALGTDKPSYTMGIGSADLNGDLKPDIYISNIVTMNKDEKYVLPDETTPMKFNPNKLATMRVIEANDLFLSSQSAAHQGVQYKLSQAVGRGYSSTGWSWDADFFDFDNDSDDDLYVLNGINEFNLYSNDNPYYTDPIDNQKKNVYIPVDNKESNVFFVNENGKLNNRSKQSGVNLVGNSRSAVYLDMDNDGDLDIVLNNFHSKAVVYRNNAETLGHHFLMVKLVGDSQNKVNLDAIGAQIIVTMADGSKVWRTIQGTTGYMSVHPKIQYFGLNNNTKADIEVIWPNGKHSRQKIADVDRKVTIIYSEAQILAEPPGQ